MTRATPVRRAPWLLMAGLAFAALAPADARAQDSLAIRAMGDSVRVRFIDTDLRAVLQAVAAYLPKPMVISGVPATRITLQTPKPVTAATLAMLVRGLVEGQGLQFVEDSVSIRIAPKPPEPPVVAAQAGTAGAQGTPVLHVFRLKHAIAADVAATVNQLYGGSGEFAGRSGLSTGTLSDELRRNTMPPTANRQGPPAAAAPPASGGALSGPVVIVPDQLTNSLLVRATEADYNLLRQAVEQLDIRPLQVLLEVLIVEARNDKNFALGADLFLPQQQLNGGSTIEGTLKNSGLGDVVVKLMGLSRSRIDAVLTLAQSRGQVNIVSRPVILTSNNAEARLLVGSQRPFVQVSRSLPTDNAARDQVVQYKDVGTKLTVRPTINQDGYVSLTVQQEISAATTETQFDAPIISTREAVTQVLVKDGQTIMLGGLKDRQRDKTQTGIPILSWIPIVGGLFGSTSDHTITTELFLFLTPRILRTDEDVEHLTEERLPEGVAP